MRDGSGKCDAFRTGAATDAVHGVLFEISSFELEKLDGAGDWASGMRRGQ